MNVKMIIREKLTLYWDYRYRKKLGQYRLTYREWLKTVESRTKDLASVSKENDFIMVSFGGGIWDSNADILVKQYCEKHPHVLLVYGDEDVLSQEEIAVNPWFKPDWSPDTFLDRDYLGDAVCVRKELYDKLSETEKTDPLLCHRRLVELSGGFERACKTIGHIEGILFHRECTWENEISNSEVNPVLEVFPMKDIFLSIIIPSKDNVSVLLQCLRTLRDSMVCVPCEIIIVDNGSSQNVRLQILDYVKKLNQELINNKLIRFVQYLYEPMEFNFSKMCNMGAMKANGNVLLFLNDDIEAVEPGWIEQMTAKAILPWVGAVGIKLWYPDSDRIQHAGITNIAIGPVHKMQFLNDNKCYYDYRNRGIRNVLAVTGASMMMRKEVFLEAGKFSEEMRVAFNDVDLCFTLHELGYYNVVVNTVHLIHHESLSRGADDSEEKMRRLITERELLYSRHPQLENTDPYYHKWLNQNALDTRILPAYLEGRRITDKADFKQAKLEERFKRDECLLLRIEYADTKRIQGYAVVLGSDNACYRKMLVFCSKNSRDKIYTISYREQYRSDIEENMPDQVHIALCGFHIEFTSTLPQGEYQIGVMAKDRISGTVLLNFSNRSVCF